MPQTNTLKRRERRRKPRLSLTRSLIARYGSQGVVIVDIHELGARIEHFAPLSPGNTATLVFDWQSARIETLATVVACRVHRFAHGHDGGTVYQSGLSFMNPAATAATALRELLATSVARSVAEQVANLRGLGPVSEREMPVFRSGIVAGAGTEASTRRHITRPHGGYIRCTFLRGRRWEKRWTRSSEAPPDGFTVLATESRDQIDMLCDDYRRTDPETRRLIRLLAQITVEEYDG